MRVSVCESVCLCICLCAWTLSAAIAGQNDLKFTQLLLRSTSRSHQSLRGTQPPNLDQLDPNKNTLLPISHKVKITLISHDFYWLASLTSKLPANFHEDWMGNPDPRIIWIQKEGSFWVGYIENLSDLYKTQIIHYVSHLEVVMQNLREIPQTIVILTLWIMAPLGSYPSIYTNTKATVTGPNYFIFYTFLLRNISRSI